jgi:hypothetical protein
VKRHVIGIVLAGLLSLWAALAGGATLTLTFPTYDVAYPAAEEFGEQRLAHSLDMSRNRDIPADYHFINPYIANGEWIAPGSGSLGYFYILNPGWLLWDGAKYFYTNYFHWYDGGTPFGPHNSIDASKYTHLAIRMSVPQARRDWIALWWADRARVWPTNLFNFYDGYVTYDSSMAPMLAPWSSGYRIYVLDLTATDWYRDLRPELTPPPNSIGTAWSGSKFALRVDPTGVKTLPAGEEIRVDWVRLFDGDTSPEIEFEWEADGVPNTQYYSIQLWVDTDNTGYDGDLIIAGMANDSNAVLKAGALPPGEYYFYLQAVRHENGGLTEMARSAYSGRVRIGAAPKFEFLAPSFTSGTDFATAELGNPWDFTNSSDVESYSQLTGVQYNWGWLRADTAGGDPQIRLNMVKNGARVGINTAKYRYFVFREQASNMATSNLLERQQRGWGARLTWWNASPSADGTYSKPVQLLEGWHTYFVDLWDRQFIESGPNAVGTSQRGWTAIPQVRHMRFDPIEANMNVRFWVDDIKLCAMNAPSNGLYKIRWLATDEDSTQVVVTLYYGYKTVLGYQEMPEPVAVLTQAPGPGEFDWNMSVIPNDEYYLRAVVESDGITLSVTSQVPIKVSDSFPRMSVRGDDPAVYRHNDGMWKILFAGQNSANNIQWGFLYSQAVPGDYNGDGTNDLAVFYDVTGRWYIRTIKPLAVLAWNYNWGWPGAIPVSGDYDGDGVDDLAVYDSNSGYWYMYSIYQQRLIKWKLQWGWPGATPVPGDYDGDGVADCAVLDKNVGRWYIYSLALNKVLLWNFQWGWKGADFVPGDFDGDGASDMTIFDRATGNWFVYSPSKKQVLKWYFNWGYAGVLPVSGDYDHDGRTDYTVYDPNTGYWYFNFSGGGYDIAGPWGASGFVPVSGNYDGQ